MKWLRAVIALGCLSTGVAGIQAQTYPVKPVRIVVPASPGGVTDTLGRALGQRLGEAWGQPVVVENRAGANNLIAAEHVAKSEPDGYTLFLSPESTFVINPGLYSKLPYDPGKSFAPVSGLISIHQALMVSTSLPVQSVKELIGLAKARPGELTYGSFGVGSSGHLNMEMLQAMAGVKFTHVPYKGATPALTDLTAGHLSMMFISVSSAVPQWKAGKARMLAVGSGKRLSQFPEVPTVIESDLPGFEATSWFGLFTTGGAPREVVGKINAEVQRIFGEPVFREKFILPNMFEPITGTPEQFAEFIRVEARKWGRILREAKIKLD